MEKIMISEILDSVRDMTVGELMELTKACEKEFDVSAEVKVIVPKDPQPKVQKTEFDVELTEFGSQKVKVIKVIREITGLGLKEAKAFVEAVPKIVKEGLSKEEAELAKPFFSRLFIYFHDQAVKKDHSNVCMRKECDLKSNQPVFLTASKVLCVDCALQYLIGNCRDWYYYLSNFEEQAGAIPYAVQQQGIKIKEQITELRSKTSDQA